MKRLILFSAFLLVLSLSCKDENETGEIPAWLQTHIDEVVTEEFYCDICRITITEFEGERYYDLYCDLWSSRYSHFYDEEGNVPEWDAEKWTKYLEEKQNVDVIPVCQ